MTVERLRVDIPRVIADDGMVFRNINIWRGYFFLAIIYAPQLCWYAKEIVPSATLPGTNLGNPLPNNTRFLDKVPPYKRYVPPLGVRFWKPNKIPRPHSMGETMVTQEVNKVPPPPRGCRFSNLIKYRERDIGRGLKTQSACRDCERVLRNLRLKKTPEFSIPRLVGRGTPMCCGNGGGNQFGTTFSREDIYTLALGNSVRTQGQNSQTANPFCSAGKIKVERKATWVNKRGPNFPKSKLSECEGGRPTDSKRTTSQEMEQKHACGK